METAAMVNTVIKHYDHPMRSATSRPLTKFDSTTTIQVVRKFIENEDDFPSSFYYSVEIYNRDHKHYFKLDDRYIQLYKPFNCVDIMINGQSTLPKPKLIKIRVTWIETNNNDEGGVIRENTGQEALDEQSNFDKHNDGQSKIDEEPLNIDSSIGWFKLPEDSETDSIPSSPGLLDDVSKCRPTSAERAVPDDNEMTSTSIRCGLKNMGNTCYMNVILQMLANITVLKDWISRNDHRTTCQQSEICALCWIEETLKGMHQKCKNELKPGLVPVYEPKSFYEKLEVLSSQFKKGTQQDCMELLLSLFNHTKESSILFDIFKFQSQRVTQCEKCKTSEPGPIENNTIMQCSIPQPIVCSLEDCLDSYCEKELLTGDNAYQCDTCNSKQDAETKIEICSTPQVLLIALKRFQANNQGKLHSAVTYEEVLHLDNWLSKYCSAKITKNHKIYHLSAVIIHRGNGMESGHYICYVKNEITNEWYEANDDSFKKAEFVFDMKKEVCLLCYVRSDLSKSIVADNNTQATGISDMKTMFVL
ncbi:unnamed protein product [Adineta steineri]|uniref:Ubiquitin carboxyl-terminal hydrolase n=1 Tax=Adineta steineri TaxID=433720 RepID=A0A814WRJ4_9BILA|nr:unnamed protein product [Adineta steineri]CAF1205989.1 unnamed protein product [Adineta steineri]